MIWIKKDFFFLLIHGELRPEARSSAEEAGAIRVELPALTAGGLSAEDVAEQRNRLSLGRGIESIRHRGHL